MMVDLGSLPSQVRDIIIAAQQMDRENLDNVEVHVCDRGNDHVRRQGLYDARLRLSEALSNAGLTMVDQEQRERQEAVAEADALLARVLIQGRE